jgi:hypothetical protein
MRIDREAVDGPPTLSQPGRAGPRHHCKENAMVATNARLPGAAAAGARLEAFRILLA